LTLPQLLAQFQFSGTRCKKKKEKKTKEKKDPEKKKLKKKP
jgi:hypothetical protein